MKEIFKDIPGYEGLYQVSNLGNVKSLSRIRVNRKSHYLTKDKLLKQNINGSGYYVVSLCLNEKKKNFTVHQLVAIAFLNHTPCGYKLVVDHINDIKTDNRLENLQIVTQRYNSRKKQEGYSSNYKGVSFNKKNKKYTSYITINKKIYHLGSFENEENASKFRDCFVDNYLNKINIYNTIHEVKEIIELYRNKLK